MAVSEKGDPAVGIKTSRYMAFSSDRTYLRLARIARGRVGLAKFHLCCCSICRACTALQETGRGAGTDLLNDIWQICQSQEVFTAFRH